LFCVWSHLYLPKLWKSLPTILASPKSPQQGNMHGGWLIIFEIIEQKWLKFFLNLPLKIIINYKLFFQPMNSFFSFSHHMTMYMKLPIDYFICIFMQKLQNIIFHLWIFWKAMFFKDLKRFFWEIVSLDPWVWLHLGQDHKGLLIYIKLIL